MIGLESGMLVQHASLGLGRVVAVERSAVHVVFLSQDARVATKLRLPMALSFLGPPASSNAWLSGLSGFTLDAKTGRYGRTTTWMSHADAVAQFTDQFPLAFKDPAYTGPDRSRGDRAPRWRRAHGAFAETLGEGKGERLLAEGDVAGLVECTIKIGRIVGPLLRDVGSVPLGAGRGELALASEFFAALFDLLSAAAPDRTRFEALAGSVAALAPGGAPESLWPTVTLLPFIARPDVHMLLRPQPACDGAQRLGYELAYEAAPSWRTYESLLASTGQLLEKLRPLGARDRIDVEAFIHAALARPVRSKVTVRAKAVAGARARPDPDETTENDPAGDEAETDSLEVDAEGEAALEL
jgi:hypothetical protein